jgi:viologen exporter family transport system permease protein
MTRITANLQFLRALFATNLKAVAAQRGQLALQAVLMFINNLCFFVFWWVLFDNVETIRGWVVADIQLLYGFSATAFGLMVVAAGGVRHISRWVDEGELDPLLVQPKATWLYAVGSRSQPSGVGDIASGVMFLAVSGRIDLGNVVLAVACVACGACVFLGSALAFYSLAFWLRRTETFSRQLLDFLILFSLYPESLFGGALRFVLFSVLPAGFIAYVPVHIIRDGALAELALLVLAAAGFLALGVGVFHRGLRRYASGSRFGVWG